ncbi:MAG TPA: hypothetical protein VM243_05095 [Phycisphaerae bacterium]|nr:hypothetical protein [Phycisphaerae bacterium]
MTDDRKDLSDHDLLIRIDERVEKLDRCMSNHLKHHWAITLAAIMALLAAAGTLLVKMLVG